MRHWNIFLSGLRRVVIGLGVIVVIALMWVILLAPLVLYVAGYSAWFLWTYLLMFLFLCYVLGSDT